MDLSKLNTAQLAAVQYGPQPLLILAGAGTGKTTVVAYRVAHFIFEQHVNPSAILALTFTNKAAREMRERTAQLCSIPPRILHFGTFHGICGRILRTFGSKIGLSTDFVIYDADEQLALVKRCAIELGLDLEMYTPKVLRSYIEKWKNAGTLPSQVKNTSFDRTHQVALSLYPLYEKRLLAAGAVDFGGMLTQTLSLLRNESQVREHYQAQWTHILVDEYQDTNSVQNAIIKTLVTPSHCLTVVGDDDQSIYRWRGADVGHILRFEEDFPGAEMIRLEENYRSTQTILDAANAVIENNTRRKGKTLVSHGGTGTPIEVRGFFCCHEESAWVASSIAGAIRAGIPPGNICVLYRTNGQSRLLEESMLREAIPYVIYGGVRFYDRKEIKDAVSLMRLVLNPLSDMDFLRVINEPARGIGKTSLERIRAVALDADVCLFEASLRSLQDHDFLRGKARQSLASFLKVIQDIYLQAKEGAHLGKLLEALLQRTDYLPALERENTPEATDRIENLGQLVNAVCEYVEREEAPSLSGFLEQVALASDIDAMSDGVQQAVSFMTIHAAKGLEFERVYFVGLEEDIFPHVRSIDDAQALEEERRLCYVAITRAKRSLLLSYAEVRSMFGRTEYHRPSRFLDEIPEELTRCLRKK